MCVYRSVCGVCAQSMMRISIRISKLKPISFGHYFGVVLFLSLSPYQNYLRNLTLSINSIFVSCYKTPFCQKSEISEWDQLNANIDIFIEIESLFVSQIWLRIFWERTNRRNRGSATEVEWKRKGEMGDECVVAIDMWNILHIRIIGICV